ncbi:MAG: dihydrodipicolinate synthase family protein [Armatimonadetes bacterium]|nr:dihydrodipicolinate synthase family protein [Armatimonadota bacterium]
MQTLAGTFVPLLMPFTDDAGSLSEIRLARLMRWAVEGGASGIVVNSEVAEFTTTTSEERKSALEFVIRESRSALPVMAHVTSLNTGSSLDLAQHASRHGARAAIIQPPYYGTYTDRELVQHFKMVAQYAQLPILVADPQKLMSEHVWTEVLAIPSVRRLESLASVWPQEFCTQESASASEFVIDHAVCSPVAGIYPNIEEHVHDPLLRPWVEALKSYGSHRSLKLVWQLRGKEMGAIRAPLLPVEDHGQAILRKLYKLTFEKETAAGENSTAA